MMDAITFCNKVMELKPVRVQVFPDLTEEEAFDDYPALWEEFDHLKPGPIAWLWKYYWEATHRFGSKRFCFTSDRKTLKVLNLEDGTVTDVERGIEEEEEEEEIDDDEFDEDDDFEDEDDDFDDDDFEDEDDDDFEDDDFEDEEDLDDEFNEQ